MQAALNLSLKRAEAVRDSVVEYAKTKGVAIRQEPDPARRRRHPRAVCRQARQHGRGRAEHARRVPPAAGRSRSGHQVRLRLLRRLTTMGARAHFIGRWQGCWRRCLLRGAVPCHGRRTMRTTSSSSWTPPAPWTPRCAATQRKIDAAKAALKNVLTSDPRDHPRRPAGVQRRNVPNPLALPAGAARRRSPRPGASTCPSPEATRPWAHSSRKAPTGCSKSAPRQFGYGSYRLLIVTDGEATDGSLTDRYTPEIIARGITMDVIGVNMKKDHTLATKVHSYRRADDPGLAAEGAYARSSPKSAPGDDTAAAEAFELLAPLPVELAARCSRRCRRTTTRSAPTTPGRRSSSRLQSSGSRRRSRTAGHAAWIQPAKPSSSRIPWARGDSHHSYCGDHQELGE